MKLHTMKYLVVFVTLIMISCGKDDFVSATIYDYGEPALDGCGWVIEVSNKVYKPVNLSSQYQIDGLSVQIDFTKLNSKANCGLAINAYDELEINKIKKE